MKNGKLLIKSGKFKFLLGLAVAGALLFAACQSPFEPPTAPDSQEPGYGVVRFIIEGVEEGTERTVAPTDEIVQWVVKFTNEDSGLETTVTKNKGVNLTFPLPEGQYTAEITAKNASNISVGKGEVEFTIVHGVTFDKKVELFPITGATGKFRYDISFPDNGGGVTYQLTVRMEKITKNSDGTIKTDIVAASFSTPSGTFTPPANSQREVKEATIGAEGVTYQFTYRLSASDARYLGDSEAVYISSDVTTNYVRAFTSDDFSTISNAVDAVAYLESEIEYWLRESTVNTALLASVDKPIDVKKGDGKTNFYYVKSKGPTTTQLSVLTRGGWALDASTWGVTGTAVNTVSLKNTQGSGNSAWEANYQVVLYPVAEYAVFAGRDVDLNPADSGQRLVSIKDIGSGTYLGSGDTATFTGTGSVVSGQIGTGANTPGLNTYVGVIGPTEIKFGNSALLRNGATVVPSTAATGSTPALENFNAQSAVYNLVIYETPVQQATIAFQRLRANFDGTDGKKQSFIDQPNALAKDKAVADPPALGDLSAANLKSTLYYVDSRVAAGANFRLNLPQDTIDGSTGEGIGAVPSNRWWCNDFGVLTNRNQIPQTTKTLTLTFTPWGGNAYTYLVDLVPVAEFYVTYNKDYFGNKPQEGASLTIRLTATDTFDSGNGKKFDPFAEDPDYGTTGKFDVETPKVAILGPTTFTLANVAVDFGYVDGSNGTNVVQDIVTDWTSVSTTPTKPPVSFDTGSGTPTAPNVGDPIKGSKEYYINVYPAISQQIASARAVLNGVSQAGLTTANDSSQKLVTLDANTSVYNFVATPGVTIVNNTVISKDIRYVGSATAAAAVPTVAIPTASTGFAIGWTVATAAGAGGSDEENKNVSISTFRFTPLGGVPESVYTFNLVPVAKFVVNFKKGPTNLNANGKITFTGSSVYKETTATNDGVSPYSVTGTDTDRTATFILGTLKTLASNKVSIASTAADGELVTIIGGDKGANLTGDTTNGIVAAGVDSKTYNIDVYPSFTDQKKQALDAIRLLTNPTGWINVTAPTTLEGNLEFIKTATPPAATDLTSEIKFMLGSTGSNPTAVVPASASTNPVVQNTDYATTWGWQAPTGGTIVKDSTNGDYGVFNAAYTFNSIGGNATGTTTGAVQEFTFRLTMVAKYVVNFKKGPVKDNVTGEVSITVTPIGTNNTVVATTIGQGSDVKVVYGAVHTTAANSNYIIDAPNNILLLDNGAKTTGTTSFEITDGAVSKTYNIYVYPSMEKQKEDVRYKLALVNSNTGWFDTTGVTAENSYDLIGSLTADGSAASQSTLTSSVQYFYTGTTDQSAAPVVKVPTDFLDTDTNYTGSLVPTQVVWASKDQYGKDQVTLTFTPIGASPTPSTYKFNLISLAKYKLQFSGSASGTVSVLVSKPGTSGNPTSLSTQTPVPNNTELKVIGSTNGASVYGGIGTRPVFSVANGVYDDVQIYQGVITNNNGTFVPDTAAASKTTTNPVDALEYTVRLFKE